jgi:hypothetical protein
MPNRLWTEEKIGRMQKEGYGQGAGANYKPWIEVTDFSSQGRSRRVWSRKTMRTHHLLSDIEYHVFLMAEWSDSVLDIWEQYPLDRDLTQAIAEEHGIPHPYYPGTHIPTVMTADFVLTLKNSGSEPPYMALNAKSAQEAEKRRSLEKLELQRRYFHLLEFPHHIAYDNRVPKQKVKNIDWIRGAALKENEEVPFVGYFEDMCQRMVTDMARSSCQQDKLVDFCAEFDSRHGLSKGSGVRTARILMGERILNAPLDAKEIVNEPVSAFFRGPASKEPKLVRGS